jgi:hypothetical protein
LLHKNRAATFTENSNPARGLPDESDQPSAISYQPKESFNKGKALEGFKGFG